MPDKLYKSKTASWHVLFVEDVRISEDGAIWINPRKLLKKPEKLTIKTISNSKIVSGTTQHDQHVGVKVALEAGT